MSEKGGYFDGELTKNEAAFGAAIHSCLAYAEQGGDTPSRHAVKLILQTGGTYFHILHAIGEAIERTLPEPDAVLPETIDVSLVVIGTVCGLANIVDGTNSADLLKTVHLLLRDVEYRAQDLPSHRSN